MSTTLRLLAIVLTLSSCLERAAPDPEGQRRAADTTSGEVGPPDSSVTDSAEADGMAVRDMPRRVDGSGSGDGMRSCSPLEDPQCPCSGLSEKDCRAASQVGCAVRTCSDCFGNVSF